jgi:hypothetical protein
MKITINSTISKGKITLICIFGIILSIMVFYISIRPIIDVKIAKTSIETEAIIISNTYLNATAGTQQKYAVKFDYTVNKGILTGTDAPYWKMRKYKIGEKIDVYYNKNNPANVQIYHISYALLGISILTLIIIILIINKNLKRIV